MKAYHIAQASKPSDLPEWLFDERERGLTARFPLRNSDENQDNDVKLRTASAPASSRANTSLAPFPGKSSPDVTSNRPNTSRYADYYDEDYERATMSRAAQRLRELRDAKANPKVKFVDTVHPRRAGMGADTESNEVAQVMPAAAPAPAPALPPPSQTSFAQKPRPSVDLSGKRPVPQGLPSGVRPRRT